jgi:DNA-binding MarR family transcriptional regulator
LYVPKAGRNSASSALLKWLLDDVQGQMQDALFLRLAESGEMPLRPAESCVFRHLNEEGARMGELAARAGMSKQAFGQHVRQLERRGFVEASQDPVDGRARILRLTPAGARHRRVAQETIAAIEAEWARKIGSSRIAELRAVLRELQEAIAHDAGSVRAASSGADQVRVAGE